MGFYTTGRFPGQYGEVLRLQNVHPLLLKILYPHQVYAHLTTFFTGPLFLVRKIQVRIQDFSKVGVGF
jgi:hypothetical protein